MNILYISASTIPSYDANSVSVVNMVNSFLKLGHSVDLIADKGESDIDIDISEFYSIENIDKFRIYYVKKSKISSILRMLLSVKLIKNVDLVYTRWTPGAFVATFFLKKYTIMEYHIKSNRYIIKLMDKVNMNSKFILRHIFITNALKNMFKKDFPNNDYKFLVLPGGAKLTYNLSSFESLSCGYIGSFKEGKGVDTIIKIAARMKNMTFHIVGGSKKEINEIKGNIGDSSNIIWHGYLPHSKALEIMNKFDIALLPNKDKVIIKNQDIGLVTSPNKMFEYMAAGKIIIATELPVLKEILVHMENSILVEQDNIDEWVSAIYRVSNDAQLRKTLREKVIYEIQEKYSWDKRAEKSLDGVF